MSFKHWLTATVSGRLAALAVISLAALFSVPLLYNLPRILQSPRPLQTARDITRDTLDPGAAATDDAQAQDNSSGDTLEPGGGARSLNFLRHASRAPSARSTPSTTPNPPASTRSR